MLWKRSHSTIRVEFINAESGEVFAQSNMPIQQLPDTFALNTTMHLGSEDWSVEKAEPMTSAEFARTGRLQLTLRRVLMMDPREILFSLPTIENALPGTRPMGAPSGPVLWIHEDDWRQVEFVSLGLQPQIDACLSKIRAVWENERVGQAFKNLHVRDEIPEPLYDVNLQLSDLAPELRAHQGYLGFLSSRTDLVAGGFSYEFTPGNHLYGCVEGERILSACLRINSVPLETTVQDSLAAFARDRNLSLIDWCRAVQMLPGTESFRRYLDNV